MRSLAEQMDDDAQRDQLPYYFPFIKTGVSRSENKPRPKRKPRPKKSARGGKK